MNRVWLCISCLLLSVASVFLAAIYWFDVPLKAPSEVVYGDEILGRGDGGRFVAQGWWLRSGAGFREGSINGPLCTSLPPGYPAFLGCLFLLTEQPDFIRAVQVVLFLMSGLLFLWGCRNVCPRFGFVGGLLISASPWGAALSSVFMSEVVSTFLSVLLVVCILQTWLGMVAGRATHASVFFSGVMASMACLTAPALAPICAGLFLLLLLMTSRRPVAAGVLFVGAAVPMSLWQLHCIRAEGRPCIMLLNPPATQRYIADWICTWARTEQEAYDAYGTFAWAKERVSFEQVPAHAFRSEEERAEVFRLTTAAAESRFTANSDASEGQLVQTCRAIASERRAEQPILVHFVLPMYRALTAVVSFRSVDFRLLENPSYLNRLSPTAFISELREYGPFRAINRVGRGLLAAWALTCHLATATIMFGVFGLITRSNWFGKSLLLLLLIFLFVFGKHAPEARRLMPAVPIFFAVVPLREISRLRNVRADPVS